MISLLLSLSLSLPGSFQTFKAFDLISGKSVEISPQAKDYRVLVFLSARCPCSMSHEPKLRALAKEFSKSGFQFVAIHSNFDEDEKLARDHFSGADLGFPVLQDTHSEIADRFQALKTPHVFVVDAKGKIVYQGGVDDSSNAEEAQKDYLAFALKNLKERKPVAVAETRALGCKIVRP